MSIAVLDVEHEAIERELEHLLQQVTRLEADRSDITLTQAMRLIEIAQKLCMLDRRFRGTLN